MSPFGIHIISIGNTACMPPLKRTINKLFWLVCSYAWDRLFQIAQNLLFIPLLCNFLYFRIQQAHPGCVAILDLLVLNYTGLNRRNIVRLDRIRLCNFCPASGFPLTLYPNLPCPTLAPISCLKEWSFQWFYDYYTVAVFDGSRFSRK